MNESKSDIVVKIVFRRSQKDDAFFWSKQCPGSQPRWGRCTFISGAFVRDYDWLVVIDESPHVLPGQKEILACPRSSTILVTSEPSSIARYGKAFSAQFGHVLTSQEERILPHPNAIRSQTGNYWYYGKTYDEVVNEGPCRKSQLISTVCSAKQQGYTMHALRYDFTQRLKAELPELDLFGKGVRYIEKKADALDPYKFHLAIENHVAPHHWTEKLADPFLGYCVPIYYGCTNVFDYFPEDSIIPIDIHDFEGSLKTIRRIVSTEGEYGRRLEAVVEARRRVMEEYNLPAMLSRIIENAEPAPANAEKGAIYSRRKMRARRPDEFIRFAGWRANNFLRDIQHRIHSGK